MSDDQAAQEQGPVAFIVANPGTSLTLGYVAVTGVGMMSNWAFFREFGINIFEFADVSDFAMAAVRTPFASLAVVAGIAASAVLMLMDEWTRERFRWYAALTPTATLKRFVYNPIAYVLYGIAYAWLAAILYADWERERIESGGGDNVAVELVQPAGRDFTDASENILLGTTYSFLFLYHPEDDELSIVPFNNVARIVPER